MNYYELLGERVNVDSFAFMVRSVAAKLYDYDASVIETMARNHESFTAWQNPVFSFEVDGVKNPVELKRDSGIYISTGYENTLYELRAAMALLWQSLTIPQNHHEVQIQTRFPSCKWWTN